MADVPVPGSVEGENLTASISEDNVDADRAALIMSVYPFAGYHSGSAYRGIRTSRYTYVRKQDQPWLLYDNLKDPYQMDNLVDSESYSGLQKEMEDILHIKLKERGDLFLPKEAYLKEWGYEVSERNKEIPYKSYETKVQSPGYGAK